MNDLMKENAELRKQVRALSDFVAEWLDRQGTDRNYMTEKARAALAAASKPTEQTAEITKGGE